MSLRSSGWLWGLLWFVAGAAVGFFANWGVTPPAPLSTPIERVEFTGGDKQSPRQAAMLVAPEGATPNDLATNNPDPAPVQLVTGRGLTAASGASLFADVGWIEVQPDERLAGAIVYVLPAGAQGVDDLDLTLHARVDGEQPTKIIVPKPGRFDVGLHLPQQGVVLIRNVDVVAGQTSPVAFAPPPTGSISLEFTGVPLPDHATASIRFHPIDPTDAVLYPGRNQPPQIGPVTQIAKQARDVVVPAGRSFRVKAMAYGYYVSAASGTKQQVPTREFDLRPSVSTARAGDTVTIDVSRRCTLRVTPQTSQVPGFLYLALIRDEQRLQIVAVKTQLNPAPDAKLWASPGPATLSWWGTGWTPGSTTVELVDGREAHAFIQPVRSAPAVALQAAPPIARPKKRLETRIRVSKEHAESDDELQAAAIHSDGGETYAELWNNYSGELRIQKSEFRSPVWVVRGSYVADRVAIRQGRTQDVALIEGGFLLISYEGPFPVDFEKRRISLRRKGGGVLWWREGHDTSEPEPYYEVQMHIGAIIGPLPPGPQSFEVRGGGVLLGTVTAHVKAGIVKPLIIR